MNKKKVIKERTVYVEGVPHKVSECGKMKNVQGDWIHCVYKIGHKGKHLYAYGTGYH